MKSFLFLFLFSIQCWSQVYLAFVEVKRPDGSTMQFEKNGRFVHMAISYKGYWLHSYPPHGVGLVTTSQLQKIGSLTIVPLTGVMSPSSLEVEKFFGKPFDYEFSWNDDKIYCAELIAKLLKIKPTPMNFSPELWPKSYQKYNGRLGISPDDIYRSLGKSPSKRCEQRFIL